MITKLKTIKITTSSRDRLIYGFVAIPWLFNVCVNLFTSNRLVTERYNISEHTLNLITIAFSLPTLLIWLAVTFAAISFYRYAKKIAGSKDAKAFRFIAYGLFAALGGLLASSILGTLQTLIGQSVADPSSLLTPFVVIRNYISITAALLTYGFLFLGSTALLEVVGKTYDRWRQIMPVLIPFVALALVYLWLVFTNDWRQVSTTPGFAPTFGLPDYLILLTVAVPYLVSWFLGISALRNIILYQTEAQGIIYKKIFKKLVRGMTVVIGLTIILQMVNQFSGFWASKGLGTILWIIVVIYLVLIYAYILVARAARELHKIEIVGQD